MSDEMNLRIFIRLCVIGDFMLTLHVIFGRRAL